MPDDTSDLIDTEDYHRRQRLKEIHKARQEVAKAVHDMEIDDRVNAPLKGETIRLAQNLAVYIQELIPIIEKAGLDDRFTNLPENFEFDNIMQFATTLGRNPETKRPPRMGEIMTIFERANKILAEVRPLIDDSDHEATGEYDDIL